MSNIRRSFIALGLVLALIVTAVFGGNDQASAAGETDLGRAIAAQEANTVALMAIDGVIGTAVGQGSGGGHVVLALTERGGVSGIPGAVDGVVVRPYVTGKILAQPKPGSSPSVDPTARFSQPVPIGVSTGHPDITAGTIGARVRDGSGNLYALSNNHVYANENLASLGDAVIQPGTFDGGSSPADNIGALSDYEPISFTADNTMDAAIASVTEATLGVSTPDGAGYGTPSSTTVSAVTGLNVTKYGRTTGETNGRVDAINATVNVGYDSGTARFVGQVIIKGRKGSFSAGGDSGSLIVTKDGSNPVALLFAGNNTVTIANPIDPVLARFNVTIDDGSTPPPPQDTGSIYGTVLDTDTGQGISGATVATDTGQTASTDGSGAYTIADVPVGTRTVTASAITYESASTSVSVVKDGNADAGILSLTPIEIGVSTVSSIQFNESYRGKNTDLNFTITVVDKSDSSPISGANVAANLSRSGTDWDFSGNTNSNGEFSGRLRSAIVGQTYTLVVNGVTHALFVYDSPNPPASGSHTVQGR